MRWEELLLDLFEDLEQQAEGLALAERDAQVADLARAHYAEVDLRSRLHGSVGRQLVLGVEGLGHVEGRLVRVGADWILVETPPKEWIVRIDALAHVRGLSDQAVDAVHRAVASRVGLGSALRGVAESRAIVVVHRTDGLLARGQLQRVGADFVELWVTEHGEAWSTGSEGHVEVLPFGSIAGVRRS